MDARLVRLRIELYTAAQSLKGEDAEAFWMLLQEVLNIKPLVSLRAPQGEDE